MKISLPFVKTSCFDVLTCLCEYIGWHVDYEMRWYAILWNVFGENHFKD